MGELLFQPIVFQTSTCAALQRGAGLDPTVASFPGASYPSGNHVAHATRCYAGESLKERLPDLSEPFPKVKRNAACARILTHAFHTSSRY